MEKYLAQVFNKYWLNILYMGLNSDSFFKTISIKVKKLHPSSSKIICISKTPDLTLSPQFLNHSAVS